MRDKVVLLTLMKRRFRCPLCVKVSTEPDEAFGLRRRSSYRFREYLGRGTSPDGEEGSSEGAGRGRTGEEIGKRLGSREANETPEFIGLDEFSVKRRRLYHTAICDLVKREVMEVVEGQGKQKVEGYLGRLLEPEKVRGVAILPWKDA